MTPQQLAILNSLVTYTAENVPGGLSNEEREVAQLVGAWAIMGQVVTKADLDRAVLINYIEREGTRWEKVWLPVLRFSDRMARRLRR